MKKCSKFILAILLVAVLMSAFTACKIREAEKLSLTFVNGDEPYAKATGIAEAKSALESQPTREGYVFKGWYLDKGTWLQKVESDNIEELSKENKSIKVYAYWVEIIDKITVSFLDYQGGILLEKEYERSDDELAKDLVKLRPSKRPDDEKYTYTFEKWICDTSDLTASNYVATPVYAKSLRTFNFNYYVDGKLVFTDVITYGEDADASRVETPKKLSDIYDYEFVGWEGNFNNITKDTDVKAIFKPVIYYTVQYINWDGTLLFTEQVKEGQSSNYGGNEPTREPNDRYAYEFIGWSSQEKLENVTQNFATQAQFEQKERTFTVTFYYGDGSTKKITDVPYGTDLTDSDELPTDTHRTSDKQYDYTFIDWDKYLGYISGDLQVNAKYKETIRKYIVTFINNGSVINTQEVEYGKYPTAPKGMLPIYDTLQYKYTKLGWQVADSDVVDSDTDFEEINPDSIAVEDNITYRFIYLQKIQQYEVKFFNDEGDEEELNKITVDYGTNVIAQNLAPTPSKESSAKYDYIFTEWSKDLTEIQSDIEVYAKYSPNIRSYTVKFMNNADDEEPFAEYTVEYGSVSPRPDEDPTKNSDVQYDYVFNGWDGLLKYIEDETVVIANYISTVRFYKVRLFNIVTHEEIPSVELAYGTKITSKISMNGYDFDSWYRDPECNKIFDMENECVDGIMMLFGNVIMQGLVINGNKIEGYNGVEEAKANLVLPIAKGGVKIDTISEKAFASSKVETNSIGSVYIPSNITTVGKYVFDGLDLTETGGVYVEAGSKPSGFDRQWLRDENGKLTDWNDYGADKKPTTYGVEGTGIAGDYRYVLIADGNKAIIDKFINNSAAKAYIADKFEYNKASFAKDFEIDVKTGIQYEIYSTVYNKSTYSVTQIGVSAYEGCKNLTTVFIPSTIEKVGNYAFSGVSANIYIAKKKPTLESTAWSLTGTSNWNKNRSGQEGERKLFWDVIAFDTVGDFNYIFKTGNVAIAAEYIGSNLTSVDVPGSITYKNAEYTVEELGAELLANMTLLNMVTVGEGIKKIGNKAFYMDLALSDVTLPSTLEEIGDYVFIGAMALKKIYIPASVKKIGNLGFVGIDSLTIYCGVEKAPGVLGVGGYGLWWDVKLGINDIDLSNLSGIAGTLINPDRHAKVFDVAGLPQTESVGTVLPGTYTYLLYNDGHAELIASDVPFGSLNTSYTIPEYITLNEREFVVTTIKASAFAGNSRIKELIIPTSVTTIEAGAFEGCSGLTIKTAHESLPSGWDSNLGSSVKNVEWGYGVSTVTETESEEEVA